MFKRIFDSIQISKVLLILSSEVKQVGKYAPKTKNVDDWQYQHDYKKSNNIRRFAQILTNSFQEGVTNHNLHFRRTLFRVFIVCVDNFVVPDYER